MVGTKKKSTLKAVARAMNSSVKHNYFEDNDIETSNNNCNVLDDSKTFDLKSIITPDKKDEDKNEKDTNIIVEENEIFCKDLLSDVQKIKEEPDDSPFPPLIVKRIVNGDDSYSPAIAGSTPVEPDRILPPMKDRHGQMKHQNRIYIFRTRTHEVGLFDTLPKQNKRGPSEFWINSLLTLDNVEKFKSSFPGILL